MGLLVQCPRHYDLETMPAACAYHCPIRRGIHVKENWHTPTTATRQGAPLYNRISAGSVADRVSKGMIARYVRGTLSWGSRRIPECGLVAFALSQDHKRIRKAARRGARDVLQVKRLGIYKRGARRLQVLELLEQRDKQRKMLASGAVGIVPLSDIEIAEIAGVSRQCVGKHKQKAGYT